jgi:Fe-S-cluster-containing dehydrogenase component
MNKKWNLIIDIEKGVDFINAVLSSKDEYVGNDYPGYSAPLAAESADIVTLECKTRGSAPIVDACNILQMCNHCDNAPCKKVGGDAVHKREDGIVIIDPIKARGRKDIFEACPYNALVWNEELQLPQNWIFDAHLLDQGWSHPRCVQSSSSGAIEAVKITDEEMQRRVQEEKLEVIRPELDTKPRVYYRNFFRYSKCFIGGTVIADLNGVETCIEHAKVTVQNTEGFSGEAFTDEFGEFKVDHISPNSGKYSVSITAKDFETKNIDVTVSSSLNLGDIRI